MDTDRTFAAGDDISSDDYFFSQDEGWIQLDGGFPDYVLKSIKVVSNAGWSLANMPKDILLAFYGEAKRVYREWLDNREGARNVQKEGSSIQYDDPNSVLLMNSGSFFNLAASTMAVLERYKRKGKTGGMTA